MTHTYFFHRKVERDGYSTIFHIKMNKKKDNVRTFEIGVEGTCCWKIHSRSGDTHELQPGDEKSSPISFISKIQSLKCE